jgi:hypothetical protein
MNAKPSCTVESTLIAMQRGQTLHATFKRGALAWTLSSGAQIPAKIAARVISLPQIAAVDTGLFSDALPQSFRHVSAKESKRI